MLNLSIKNLDQQSSVVIYKWIDLDSEEYKIIDDNPAFTKKCIKIGFEENFIIPDSLGRLWCKGSSCYHPFHLEYGKLYYGLKISAKAAN